MRNSDLILASNTKQTPKCGMRWWLLHVLEYRAAVLHEMWDAVRGSSKKMLHALNVLNESSNGNKH